MAEAFGAYELGGRIALGGMAEVFRARRVGDAGFSKSLVIKRVLPHFAEDEDFVRMFIDEAVLAAKLSHPNVVSVFDFGTHEGQYFIAMEYVEGVDLRRLTQFAKRKGVALSANHAVQIALGMTRGLGHAHERKENGRPLGIVHRDVSPHNVLISFEGEVKVFDFGIARAAARATRTTTGVVKGKLGYMAPEQARGEELDARCDIYATGLVLWELLSGRRAFSGDNEMQVLVRVQKGDLPRIDTVISCEPALAECVSRLCAPALEDRYPSMREAERELAKILHALGGADAARLDELVQAVVDPDLRLALQGDSEPHPGTMSLLPPVRDGSDSKQRTAAVMEEATAAESRSAVTWSAPAASPDSPSDATHTTLAPSRELPPPKRPTAPTLVVDPGSLSDAVAQAQQTAQARKRRTRLAVAALVSTSVAVLIGIFVDGDPKQETTTITIDAPVAGPTAPTTVPLPQPTDPPVISQPTAQPTAQPTEAHEPGTKKDGVRREDTKATAPPTAKATAFVSFAECPPNATFSVNGHTLKTTKNVPVPAGAHEFTVKDAAGQFRRFPRMELRAGDSEILDCRDAK